MDGWVEVVRFCSYYYRSKVLSLLALRKSVHCYCYYSYFVAGAALSATHGSHSVAGAPKHSSSRETTGKEQTHSTLRDTLLFLPLLIFLLLLLVVVVVPLLLIDESCDSPSTTIDTARALPLSNSTSLPPPFFFYPLERTPSPPAHSLLLAVVVAIVHARFLPDSLSLLREN